MRSTADTQEEYYRGVRMAPYDLLKELGLALAAVAVLAIVLSAFLSSPDVPPVTIATWSQADPVDFVTTATGELAGTTTSAGYGQPYNSTPTPFSTGARSRRRPGSACASPLTRRTHSSSSR